MRLESQYENYVSVVPVLAGHGPSPYEGAMRLLLPAAALALLAACGGPPAGNALSANDTASASATNAAAQAPAPAPLPANEAAAYLPTPGAHPARAMTLAPPPEAVQLRDRMAAAVMRNRAWYDSWAAQHPRGDLPWHANLGVSEADYARYLALTRRIGLNEQGRVTLNVTRRPDGGLTLAAGGAASALNGLVLYPARGQVETPLGVLATVATSGNDAADSPLGRWRGAEWSNRGRGAPRQVRLIAGRRDAGDLMLYYDYGPSDAETVILLYPAAAAR